MTYFSAQDPEGDKQNSSHQVEIEIVPRSVDLGGFKVGRILPSAAKRTVGPFVFWDQADLANS